MSGKSRIIRSVKSRCTTCGTKNCFRINVIENILINAKSNCCLLYTSDAADEL